METKGVLNEIPKIALSQKEGREEEREGWKEGRRAKEGRRQENKMERQILRSINTKIHRGHKSCIPSLPAVPVTEKLLAFSVISNRKWGHIFNSRMILASHD